MTRLACKYCGSDVDYVDPRVGAHMLCHVRAKHDAPTPSLGVRCPACDGTGIRPGAPKFLNVNVMGQSAEQFDNMMDGLHCKECKHSGIAR